MDHPMDFLTAAALGELHALIPHLTRGANINEKNVDGWNALHYAASYEKEEVAKLLVSLGANRKARCDTGRTPAMIAASSGNVELIKILLSMETLEWVDKQGKSALFIAIDYGNEEAAEYLLSRGADPNIRVEGVSPLQVASQRGHLCAVNLLLKWGAKADSLNQRPPPSGQFNLSYDINQQGMDDLERVLSEIGLEKYMAHFRKNDINLTMFLEMTEEDFKAIGIKLLGPRRKLSMAIAHIKAMIVQNGVTQQKS